MWVLRQDTKQKGVEEWGGDRISSTLTGMPRCSVLVKNGEIWKKLEGLVESEGGGKRRYHQLPQNWRTVFPHCSANWFCNKLEGIWQDIQPEHGQCIGTKINHEEVGSFSLDVSEVRHRVVGDFS